MDSIFFFLSKLVWLVAAPDSLLLILLLIAWTLLCCEKHRSAKRVLGFVVVILLIVALFPVDEWVLYPLEIRFPTNPVLPQKVDGIVVLSGAEDAKLSSKWNQVELGGAAERLLAFQALARRYPEAKLVFTGGSGSMVYQEYKGADVAKMVLEQQGMNISHVIFETESRNTYENAVLSKVLAKPVSGENWILITSAFHMPRSIGIFCRAGWPMIPYPVDHYTWSGHLFRVDLALTGHLGNLAMGIREWLGLVAYYATGKTTALIPPRCG
jgi:uncharacterized SAM-binding protein YcdF (DUF218 family)